jgi:hypothetical protein
MFVFGGGDAWFTPLQNTAANPTPMQLFAIQECSIEFSASSKSMMGKQQFPLAVARTEGKVAVKVKFGNVYLKLWNDIFFGASVVAGSETIGIPRQSNPAGTTATPTVPAGSTFFQDLGVADATSGKQMTLLASAPVAGVSYEEAAGVYTFGSGQGATLISFSVKTTATTGTGFSSNVTNQPMGTMPIGQFFLSNTQYANLDGSQNVSVRLPACIAAKMTPLPGKNNDWDYTEMEFEAFSDNAGNICYLSSDE